MALLLPAAASARAQETIFDAPRELIGGATPESRAEALNELRALGADTVRINLPWRYLVPRPGRSKKPAGFNASDPGDYPQTRWGTVDGVVSGALGRGMQVLMTPSGPIPELGECVGPQPHRQAAPQGIRRLRRSGRPALQRLVPAAALHRRRPADRRPQPATRPSPASRTGRSTTSPTRASSCMPQRRRGRAVSPGIYRRLFLAAQKGLRQAGHGKDRLLIGETAPSGGDNGVDPIEFLRGVLCLRPTSPAGAAASRSARPAGHTTPTRPASLPSAARPTAA